ncbi:DUF1533 domain-containing protein [Clostridium sp. AM16-23]|nr:DUF1533 domain-containing protein [Clostridium sp. AM16-23]RHO38752.1 DUF1533 domain-containing protein [Clostridium sp. AM16-23]
MKGIRKNGFKGVAVAAALSMTMTTMVSPAATAIPTGRWEQSLQTGAWKYRSVTGEYAADQWLFENGKWYRFDKDGNMITGWYQNPVTKDWYYLWANGSMATGWVPVGGRWYYLSASGEMAHDGTTPDGYKVNANGAWVDANGKEYDAPGGEQKTSGKRSGGSDGSSDSDSGSSSGGNSSNSGNNSGNNGNAGDSGNNSGNNGNTGDNGNNSGSNEKPGDGGNDSGNEETPEKKTLVVESQTKLVDLGWSQYVTVAFAKGYSLDDCTLTVDGIDVTSAFTKVDRDGTIAKWEITNLNPAVLAVTGKDGETQIIRLSENENPEAPEVRENTAPAAFLAHGSVYVWDYHLDNYDESGNIRYKPETTTFDLGEEKSGIRYYAPAAELTEDKSNRYGVGGQAVVMFNYTEEVDKQWFNEITKVALVSGKGYNNTINGDLRYEKKLGEHYGNTVGQIIVPLGQSNFYSNGSYYLRITSGGKNTLIPIEVVNGTAPSMVLKEAGAITSGKNIHFEVKNMTYGIEIPVSKVELTDPHGNTTELEKIRDWYLIGNTFVLYNDENAENGRNNIPEAGKYTITVHSTGFKDMSYTFTVSTGAAAQNSVVTEDIYGIDAMSSASISGGSTSGSGNAAEGGSTTMSADLMFDADLLTNALLLKNIGVENESAQAIADRWNYDMSGWDAVIGEDGTTFYSFAEYRDAVEKAKNKNGEYLSFADYIADESAAETLNRPYAVKYVLEDNRLGGTMMSGSYLGKTAPKLVLVDENGDQVNEILEGQDVRIMSDDTAYLQKIVENGKIYLNGNSYQAVDQKLYRLKDNILVLDSSLFAVNKDNQVTIKVDGYEDKVFNIAIAKDLKEVALEAGGDFETGAEVTITNTADKTGDIWKNLQSVVLTGPDGTKKRLLPNGQESISEKIGYTIGGASLVLGKDLFKEAGEYSVEISAQYYGVETVEFEITKKEEEKGDDDGRLKETPTVSDTDYFFGSYTIAVGMGNDDWMNAITGVTVNGETYEKGYYRDNTYSLSTTDGKISLDKAGFTENENVVVISAEGYKDLEVILDQKGNLVEKAPEESEEKPAPLVGDTDYFFGSYTITVGMGNDDWMNAITGVTVNGEAYEKGYYRDNTYSLSTTDGKISLDKAGFTENENVVVISAEGYVDLEVVLDKNGKQVIEKASTMAIELPEMIINTEPIEEEKPAVSEEISRKGSELSEKKVSSEETKEEDIEESTEDAEDVENSGDAEAAETENETETAAESEPNTKDATEENVLEEAAEL